MDDINELYICEKPSQGRDLARVLGCTKSGDGHICNESNGVYVTWAIGHLLSQLMPGDYDDADKKWKMDRLPLIPTEWKKRVKPSTSKQFKIVINLIKRTKCLYVSTDAEREGEGIARELLDEAGYKGEVKRLWMQGLDDVSIKRALANIRPGHNSINLYYECLARERADYLVGINASRAFTLIAQQAGMTETLHVGRVITPTVALVCNRDLSIKNFQLVPFYTLECDVAVNDQAFTAHWTPPDDVSDEHGRCLDKDVAEAVAVQCDGAEGVISDVESKSSKQSAPLPFCLTSLQQYCSKRWGYTADQVLDACQSLYETHKLLTYPRTDSRYLPRSMFDESQQVSKAIGENLTEHQALINDMDFTSIPRCYKDEKVTAHHAIIPTSKVLNDLDGSLKEIEKRIYDAVSIFFIANFYPQYEFEATRVVIESKRQFFEAKGKVTLNPGWKVVFVSEDQYEPKDEQPGKSNSGDSLLPSVLPNDSVTLFTDEIGEKQTRPLPHFTDASLLSAMDNIHRFIEEPKLKQVIREGGIGTPATRASILSGAIGKGYLQRYKKKYLLATSKAFSLISIIPSVLSSPGYTAVWEQQLRKISHGQLDFNDFVQQIESWISKIVEQVKSTSASNMTAVSQSLQDSGSIQKCFECEAPLRRLKNKTKKTYFWACTDRENCNMLFPDKNGKPYKPQESPPCPDCGKKMFLRKGLKPGNKRKTQFWGCSAYPECRATLPVKNTKNKESA